MSHICGNGQPCGVDGDGFRRMQDDDWVKFGAVLYLSKKGARRAEVLERHQQAWRTLYQQEAPLDHESKPIDRVGDSNFRCAGQLPWFDHSKWTIIPPAARAKGKCRGIPVPPVHSHAFPCSTSNVEGCSRAVPVQFQCNGILSIGNFRAHFNELGG